MKLKYYFLIFVIGIVVTIFFTLFLQTKPKSSYQDPEFENIDNSLISEDIKIERRFPDFSDWQRPDGPLRVGLQVGHWKTQELPDELQRIRERGGGTSGGGRAEWEVNLVIAEKTASILQDQGIIVDILPATIPIAYWADAFVAIHADGSENQSASGFKVASAYGCFSLNQSAISSISRLGWTGRHRSNFSQWTSRLHVSCPQGNSANKLVELLETEYKQVTNLDIDSNITHNMRGYYAFNWRRYEHAVHPMTASVIIETGFLTNPSDRLLLIGNPQKSAQGIAAAIIRLFRESSDAL